LSRVAEQERKRSAGRIREKSWRQEKVGTSEGLEKKKEPSAKRKEVGIYLADRKGGGRSFLRNLRKKKGARGVKVTRRLQRNWDRKLGRRSVVRSRQPRARGNKAEKTVAEKRERGGGTTE